MKVFLSYAHEDHRLASEIRRALEQSQADVEVAFTEDLRAGESWAEETRRAIDSANLVVLIIGHHQREGQRGEWSEALAASLYSGGPAVLPIVSSGSDIPAFLRDRSYLTVDAGDDVDWDAALAQLTETGGFKWTEGSNDRAALHERLTRVRELAAELPAEP